MNWGIRPFIFNKIHNIIRLPLSIEISLSNIKLDLKIYANITTTRSRSPEVIDFIKAGWNSIFLYARTQALVSIWLGLLSESMTLKAVCPSPLSGVENTCLGEQHLHSLPSSGILGRMTFLQVWWLRWLLK